MYRPYTRCWLTFSFNAFGTRNLSSESRHCKTGSTHLPLIPYCSVERGREGRDGEGGWMEKNREEKIRQMGGKRGKGGNDREGKGRGDQ